jgi:hypothetical protein
MDKFAEPARYCIEQSNTAMSDTARTDEGIYRAIDAGHAMYHGAIVRKLERELAEAVNRASFFESAMCEQGKIIENLEAQRDRLAEVAVLATQTITPWL